LNSLAVINGCSDDFTRVDVQKFKIDLEKSETIVYERIVPGLYAMVGILAVNMFVMSLYAFGFIGKKSRPYHEHADE
jgi:hypothetical protein